MELYELAKQSGLHELAAIGQNQEITGISDNSADVEKGNIFVAISGFVTDGHRWIEEAIKNGASIVIGEKPLTELEVPYVQVENSRAALGALAATFYRLPSHRKKVIGVTGTNGKTTTTFFLKHILEKLGSKVSLMGSVYNEMNGSRSDTFLTTPTALTIQQLLSTTTDDFVIIECSSQGLDQGRLVGTEFDYALFSNLTKDHITYHGGEENYYQAKKQLFNQLKTDGVAGINTDNQAGVRLAREVADTAKKVLTTGVHADDTLAIEAWEGDMAKVIYQGKTYQVDSPLPGSYNTDNLLLALLAVIDLYPNFDLSQIDQIMEDFEGVPGRIEEFKIDDSLSIVVDYAHTADALEVLSKTINKLYKDTYKIQVLGYRASRDLEKRKPMMHASSSMADHVILTTIAIANSKELPSYEEYQGLMNDKSQIILNRVEAIKEAIKLAREQEGKSVIVITGKGRTPYHLDVDLGTKNDIETLETLLDKKLS